jgi:DNA-directed RNA polymerase specialized sigma24 family protein
MRAEGEVVRLPSGVEARARFDEFVEDEHERLYKALYFVTGSREEAEDLSQDAFLKLWAMGRHRPGPGMRSVGGWTALGRRRILDRWRCL